MATLPSSTALAPEGSSGRHHHRTIALAALALLAGAVVALSSPLGTVRQAIVVVVLGAGVPALLLILTKPHLFLAVYLAILPLLLPWPVAAGLNAGEALTLFVITLGVFGLWTSPSGVRAALTALSPMLWPVVGLAVVSVISLIVNGIVAPEQIVSALLKILAFGIAAVLVHVHAKTPQRTRQLIVAAICGAVGVAVYAVIAYLRDWSSGEELLRASGTFEHWNQLGGFMALMSMPTLALAIASRTALKRILFATAFLLQITALLLSLTLGSILAFVVGGGLALVFLVRVSVGRLFATALLFAATCALVFAINEPLRHKVMNIGDRVTDRLGTYAVGVSMFRDRFWFGFGSEQNLVDQLWFGEADYGITIFGPSSSVPHNAFLKVGVEKGVFGVALFTLLMLGALRVLFRGRTVRLRGPYGALYTGIGAGTIAFLVQNMTNDLVLHARIGIVFFALVALSDRLGAGE